MFFKARGFHTITTMCPLPSCLRNFDSELHFFAVFQVLIPFQMLWSGILNIPEIRDVSGKISSIDNKFSKYISNDSSIFDKYRYSSVIVIYQNINNYQFIKNIDTSYSIKNTLETSVFFTIFWDVHKKN